MKATVTSKGQITIPIKIREKHGIKPGTVLEFDEDSSALKIKKSIDAKAWDEFRASATAIEPDHPWANMTSEGIIEDMRGPVELPPKDNANGD